MATTKVINKPTFMKIGAPDVKKQINCVPLQLEIQIDETDIMMNKKIVAIALFSFMALTSALAQKLSDTERTLIVDELQNSIKTLSQFRYDAPELLAVYNSQLAEAEKLVKRHKNHSDDTQVFDSWYTLKNLADHSRQMLDFLMPRAADLTYRQGMMKLKTNDIERATILFNKAIGLNDKHIMANYQLAKLDIDSMQLASGGQRLARIVNEMSPDADQKTLIYNLLHHTYNKNYLYAIGLASQGKHARAMEVYKELEKLCQSDTMNICNSEELEKSIAKSKHQIYSDHLKIAKKSLKNGRNAVAENFAVIAYEYYAENKKDIQGDADFKDIIKQIANNYIAQAKQLEGDRKAALYQEYLDKAKQLTLFLESYERDDLKTQLARLEPIKSRLQQKHETIEENAKDTAYTDRYSDYLADDNDKSPEEIQIDVDEMEKKYVNEKTKTVASSNYSISKAVDEKFYETRSLLSVNSFEKALEVLEKANQLAKIETDKAGVEEMYRQAIREISAKRMSAAEYAVWQGNTAQADSLVSLTNDLIHSYKMEHDTAVARIMNSYLNALDQKVCSNRQDQLNTFVFNIMDCIKRSDYYNAEAYVREALAVPETRKCKLDKSKLKALMKQIEKPLEYIDRLDDALTLLRVNDTANYLQQYGALESMYNMYDLESVGVNHTPLRQILTNMNNPDVSLDAIEILVRHKDYIVALEALGSMKDMGYKESETKKVQQRLAKLMAYDMNKQNYSLYDALDTIDKYASDKWYATFAKEFKKEMKNYSRRSR